MEKSTPKLTESNYSQEKLLLKNIKSALLKLIPIPETQEKTLDALKRRKLLYDLGRSDILRAHKSPESYAIYCSGVHIFAILDQGKITASVKATGNSLI